MNCVKYVKVYEKRGEWQFLRGEFHMGLSARCLMRGVQHPVSGTSFRQHGIEKYRTLLNK